jgi:hypothetical protein
LAGRRLGFLHLGPRVASWFGFRGKDKEVTGFRFPFLIADGNTRKRFEKLTAMYTAQKFPGAFFDSIAKACGPVDGA